MPRPVTPPRTKSLTSHGRSDGQCSTKKLRPQKDDHGRTASSSPVSRKYAM
jgi:hypothetical protein